MYNSLCKFAVSLAVLLLLIGCTNNTLTWKFLYGQFDYYLNKQLLSYAEFDDTQESLIRAAVNKTVQWHRHKELQHYTTLISQFQKKFLAELPDAEDVDWLFASLRETGVRFDRNSPLLELETVLISLSDKQIQQISKHIDKKFIEAKKKWDKQSKSDPAELSAKNISKALKRIGLTANADQKTALIDQLKQRQISRPAQRQVWKNWSDELLDILANRQAQSFTTRFRQHHFARVDYLESNFPQQWRHDQSLYKTMVLNLFRSLQPQQKESMNLRLNKLKRVARELNQGA